MRTKHGVADTVLVGKAGNQFARDRIPELGGFVCARRENPGAVGTKDRILDAILMGKGRYKRS